MNFTRILTFATLVGSALMAGVFFAYGNSVMPSLEAMPEGQGAEVMNEINVQVYNPLFMLVLNGTALVCLVLAILGPVRSIPGKWWLLTGSVLYLASVIITGAVNVPLNDQLAAVDPATAEGAAEWSRFADSWSPANDLRAVACALGVIAFGLALVGSSRRQPAASEPTGRVRQPGAFT